MRIFLEKAISAENEQMSDLYIYYQLLNTLKPLFEAMLVEVDDFKLYFDEPRGGDLFEKIEIILLNTYQSIQTYHHLRDAAIHHNNLLFYNADDSDRFYQIYEASKQKCVHTVFYESMQTGFNHVTREWEEERRFSVDELISFILDNKIKRIVAQNMYFLECILNIDHVYLLVLMEFIGVEYVIIDHDVYPNDQIYGHVSKAFFSWDGFTRFSVFPHLQEHWDKAYAIKNIHYIISPQDTGSNQMEPLVDDYGIIVLSNSRVEQTLSNLPAILYLFEQFSDENIFDELQRWYFAIRYLLLNELDLPFYERQLYHDQLYFLYIDCISFIKYEVIHNIETSRRVKLYGDNGWDRLFPQYAQGRFLNSEEKQHILRQRQHLYLLLNANYTYLEANPVVTDAISKNIPFIGLPAMVRTDEFAGFQTIEYYDKTSLNQRIEQANQFCNDLELISSINMYRDVFTESLQTMQSYILEDIKPRRSNRFERLRRTHEQLVQKEILNYILSNSGRLMDTFETLCMKKVTGFRIKDSKFIDRPYVQVLIKAIK